MDPMLSSLPNLAPPPPTDAPPVPPPGEIVTPQVLYLNQSSTYRLAEAFTGLSNPSVLWQQMISDRPEAILYYRELEEKDEDVADAMAEIKLSVMKREMTVMPGDESTLGMAARDFVDAQLKGITGLRNALDGILDAPFYGYTISELILDQSEGQVAVQDIRDCPQELFDFGPLTFPQIGQLRLKNIMGSYDGTPVPEEKFLIYSSRVRSRNRKGRALLRRVFWPSWFKRQTQRFWLRLAERGPGTAVVKYSQGATRDEQTQALAAAEAVINSVAIAVPDNFAIVEDLLKMARTADPAVYEKLCDKLEAKIYRGIVGSTLTSHGSDGGKGTQALGNVHADTKEDRSVEMTLGLQEVLNRQLVKRLVFWNFGPDCPMPTVQFDISNEEDLGTRVTVDDTLQSMGLEIPINYARTRYGVPAPQEGEEVLARPAAPVTTLTTPAGPPDKPAFSERGDAQTEALVTREQREFDELLDQLRDESKEIYRKRIEDVADGTILANTR